MNPVAEVLSTVFGIVLVGAIAFEIRQRRKRLRDLYNVLDAEDKNVVAELDMMVANGQLEPYVIG
jgi:predicted MarR family transcription regulator